MTTFQGLNGQSIFDVCMNTYGSLDFLYKLLTESNVENIDQPVVSQQKFVWDETQTFDNAVLKKTTLSGIIFATAGGNNGNTFYIATETPNFVPNETPYIPPVVPAPQYAYEATSQSTYTATVDGEKVITLLAMIGFDIIQIEKEIKPLKPTDFSWNKATGILTLGDDFAMAAEETLYILKKQIITI